MGLQDILEIEVITSQKSYVALIMEVIEFNFDIWSDLRGHLETTIMAVISDIPLDVSAIDIAYLKFEVQFDLWDHLGCKEVTTASSVT